MFCKLTVGYKYIMMSELWIQISWKTKHRNEPEGSCIFPVKRDKEEKSILTAKLIRETLSVTN